MDRLNKHLVVPRQLGVSKLGRSYSHCPTPSNHPMVLLSPVVVHDSAQVLPDEVDLRPFCTPVKNQESYGCCSGESTSGFVETLMGKNIGHPMPFQLSELYAYYQTRIIEKTFPQDSGSYLADDMSILQSYGICPEVDFPFSVGLAATPPPIASQAAPDFKIIQPCSVDWSNTDNLKAVLAAGKPVLFGFQVYESFEATGGDGVVAMADPSQERFLGGHAVLMVGYKKIVGRDYFIIRNSWGAGWGDNGYCYMPSDYNVFFDEAWTASLV